MSQERACLFDALNAASHGYAVLPAHPKSGQPFVKRENASSDPEVIRDWWDKYPEAAPAILPPKPKELKPTPFVWRDPKTIPPREFVYGKHLIRKFTSAKFSAGGVGKSSLAVCEALAMATGRPLLGITPRKRCRVWYWNGEDPREETERRIVAVCLHFGITETELKGWFFFDSGRDQPITIAVQHPKEGAKIAEPMARTLVDAILADKIDVLIIDPFVSCHRVTENDTMAMELVAKRWNAIADETNIAIELVHHTRKTGGVEATAEDGRGAVALLNAVRSAQVLNRMSKEDGEKSGVDNYREYFSVDNGKVNIAPPSEGKDWYRIQSVLLGNGTALLPDGDDVGVVVRWKWPDPTDGVTGADFESAAAAIRAGRWKENIQAKDWVGIPVARALGLNLTQRADKAKVKGLVKIWIAAGSLVVVEEVDAHRETKKFVKVANDE